MVLPHERRARRRARDRQRRGVLCRRLACCANCCSTTSAGQHPHPPPRHQGRLRVQPPARRRPVQNANHELTVEVVSPLGDDYDALNDARAVLRSSEGNGRALIRLSEGERFDIELTLYRQIEKYIDSPKASNATPSLRNILINRKDENRERRQPAQPARHHDAPGRLYALGQRVELKGVQPGSLLDELGNYLITNTYTKLGFQAPQTPTPSPRSRPSLLADDTAQRKLALLVARQPACARRGTRGSSC